MTTTSVDCTATKWHRRRDNSRGKANNFLFLSLLSLFPPIKPMVNRPFITETDHTAIIAESQMEHCLRNFASFSGNEFTFLSPSLSGNVSNFADKSVSISIISLSGLGVKRSEKNARSSDFKKSFISLRKRTVACKWCVLRKAHTVQCNL